ncbi:MAG: nitronate monooxygenase [Rhizomicrobium sp.]
MTTPLTRLLGCRYPVIQTAMGWVATPRLVAAACEAGAFGFLAGAVMTARELEAAIAEVREKTQAPFGVNFHMFQPEAAAIVDIVIAHRVRAVSFGRGPDATAIARFRKAGILCVPTVGALKHARKMEELGVDMLVVQGGEGGGHTGGVATTVLLPQVLDAVAVPVVAAGGFADGRGLAAALAYGAVGIAMGTRFLLTQESPVPAATKQRYLAADAGDIVVSTKLDGLPQRMIRNRVLARIDRSGRWSMWLRGLRAAVAMKRQTGASWPKLFSAARKMRRSGGLGLAQAMMAGTAPTLIRKAIVEGEPENGILPSGQIAGLIDEIPTCHDLVDRIAEEARQCIAALAPYAAAAAQA